MSLEEAAKLIISAGLVTRPPTPPGPPRKVAKLAASGRLAPAPSR